MTERVSDDENDCGSDVVTEILGTTSGIYEPMRDQDSEWYGINDREWTG